MKYVLLLFLIFDSSSIVAQSKDTEWFRNPVTWEFTSYRGSFQTLNEYTDKWRIDKEFFQETPILITSNHITIFAETAMKFEILELPYIKSYSNYAENGSAQTYTWLNVRDLRREIECDIQLLKFRSNGGSLDISYNKIGTRKKLFITRFMLK